MQDYAKVFASILTSSLMEETVTVRWVFLTMIILRDLDDFVRATPEALSRVANVRLDDVKKALACLEAPDPCSRSREDEGRRVRPVPGGWFVINGDYYRNLLSEEDKREKARVRQARHRDKLRHAPVTPVTEITTGEERRGEERKGEGGSAPEAPTPYGPLGSNVLRAWSEAGGRGSILQLRAELKACHLAGVSLVDVERFIREHPGLDVFDLGKGLIPRVKAGAGNGQKQGPPAPKPHADCPDCKGSGYRPTVVTLRDGTSAEAAEPCPCRDRAPQAQAGEGR